MQLSQNFSLEEFLVSQTAERNGIDMTPPPHIVRNLEQLVVTCMQPLRDNLGATIYISSGWRPPALNRLIGGSETSAHPDGRACDFRAAGYTPLEVCQMAVDLGLPLDQIIHEFGRWSHLGIADAGRRQELTAYRKSGRVQYANGLHEIEELI